MYTKNIENGENERNLVERANKTKHLKFELNPNISLNHLPKDYHFQSTNIHIEGGGKKHTHTHTYIKQHAWIPTSFEQTRIIALKEVYSIRYIIHQNEETAPTNIDKQVGQSAKKNKLVIVMVLTGVT